MKKLCITSAAKSGLMALFMLTMAECAMAQKAGPPDPLMETSVYIRQAQQELDCSTNNARNFAKKAVETIGRYRSSSPSYRDAAGILKGEAILLLKKIDRREEDIKMISRSIEGLMKQNRMASASYEIQLMHDEAPSCNPRFHEWQNITASHSAQAARLAEEGDGLIRNDPRQALELYRSAGKLDIETKDLSFRVQRAMAAIESERRLHSRHIAKKVFWTVMVTAVVGGCAYYGYQYHKKHQKQEGGLVISPP